MFDLLKLMFGYSMYRNVCPEVCPSFFMKLIIYIGLRSCVIFFVTLHFAP